MFHKRGYKISTDTEKKKADSVFFFFSFLLPLLCILQKAQCVIILHSFLKNVLQMLVIWIHFNCAGQLKNISSCFKCITHRREKSEYWGKWFLKTRNSFFGFFSFQNFFFVWNLALLCWTYNMQLSASNTVKEKIGIVTQSAFHHITSFWSSGLLPCDHVDFFLMVSLNHYFLNKCRHKKIIQTKTI